MKELKIDAELKDLLPPLSKEEYKQLEKNIVENGFDKNFPIMEWNGYIVDGHNRYNICKDHNITDYVIGSLAYKTKEEVMEWMLDIQLGRRNLSPIQRIAVAEKYRPIYERQAKKNMSLGGRNYSPKEGSQSSSTLPIENKIDVRAKLAKTAGVSTDTYSKGKKILDSDNETLKQEVLSGEKSINADYKATNTYTNVKCRLNNIQVGVSQVSADFTCNNVRLNTTSQGFRAIYNSSMLSWIGFSTTLDIVEVGSNSEVVKGLEDMKEEQEKTNEKLDGINDSITSTEGPDLGSLENSAGWLPAGPVDSILNLPLTLMNNIVTNLSKSCSPITFSLPFVHEQMTLPCISTIYSQIEGLSVWINTISYMVAAIILFHYFMTLYKWVDDTLSFRENNWNDTDQWGGV